jgi:hypothetical protein
MLENSEIQLINDQFGDFLKRTLKPSQPAEELFFPTKKGKYLLMIKITGIRPRRFSPVKISAKEVVQPKQSRSISKMILERFVSISFIGK